MLFIALAVLLYLNADHVRRSWASELPSSWQGLSPAHETKEAQPPAEMKSPVSQDSSPATSLTPATLASFSSSLNAVATQSPSVASKIIVMAKLKSEDTDWVADKLRE